MSDQLFLKFFQEGSLSQLEFVIGIAASDKIFPVDLPLKVHCDPEKIVDFHVRNIDSVMIKILIDRVEKLILRNIRNFSCQFEPFVVGKLNKTVESGAFDCRRSNRCAVTGALTGTGFLSSGATATKSENRNHDQ